MMIDNDEPSVGAKGIVKVPRVSWVKGIFYSVVLSVVISMPLLIHQLPDVINAMSKYNCASN